MAANDNMLDQTVPGSSNTTIKTVAQASISIASLSLGILALITFLLGIGLKCTGPKGEKISVLGPMAVSAFVGAGALFTWRLRADLLNGIGIIETFPPFYSGSSSGSSSGYSGPEKPPGLVQWENWIGIWLLCFVAIVVGGAFVLDTYATKPLTQRCEHPDNTTGILSGLENIRSIVYTCLIVVTCVPLLIAVFQKRKLDTEYKNAVEEYERAMHPEQFSDSSDPSTDDIYQKIKSLKVEEGGYTADGNTMLYNASYAVAKLVGYIGGNESAQSAAQTAGASAQPDMSALQ